MDLKVPVTISDELFDEIISSKAVLNLASGEITQVEYQNYNAQTKGLPWEHEDYDFSCGMLSSGGKDVEFTVQVNQTTGQYTVSATELLEIKVRAAALFSGIPSTTLLEDIAPKTRQRKA